MSLLQYLGHVKLFIKHLPSHPSSICRSVSATVFLRSVQDALSQQFIFQHSRPSSSDIKYFMRCSYAPRDYSSQAAIWNVSNICINLHVHSMSVTSVPSVLEVSAETRVHKEHLCNYAHGSRILL